MAAPKEEWSMDDFEIGKYLGQGKFAKVYLAREKKSGYVVALKVMGKEKLEKYKLHARVRSEIEIHSGLNHPNVLRLFAWFRDEERIVLVLEYAARGGLDAALRTARRFSERVAATYVASVADALVYCHKNQVIHRDIKPENLLLDREGRVKIADFGWAGKSNARRETFCGTLDYLAPELLQKQPHSHLVDSWTLGILCYEFLYGKAPFEAVDDDDTKKKIVEEDLKFPPAPYVSPEAKDFISKLLVKNPKKRLSLEEVRRHAWIQKNAGPTGSCIKKNKKAVVNKTRERAKPPWK